MVNNSTVECPFCRTVTNIVNNDITKLLKNFALIEVIEDARYSLNKKDVVVSCITEGLLNSSFG